MLYVRLHIWGLSFFSTPFFNSGFSKFLGEYGTGKRKPRSFQAIWLIAALMIFFLTYYLVIFFHVNTWILAAFL